MSFPRFKSLGLPQKNFLRDANAPASFPIPKPVLPWKLLVMLSEVGFKITWHQKKFAIKPQPFPFGSQLCSSQIPGPLYFPCTFNVHSSNLHLMQAAGCKYP